MNLQPKFRASSLPAVKDTVISLLARRMLCGTGIRTLCRDLSFAIQIALVANHNHGEVVLVLDAQYLLLECLDFFKRLLRGDGVDEQETLAGAHVLFSHGGVFFLASGIQDIEQGDFVIDNALLAV